MTRKTRILAAVVAGLLLVGFLAVPLARACMEDAGLSLIDGELPGGG